MCEKLTARYRGISLRALWLIRYLMRPGGEIGRHALQVLVPAGAWRSSLPAPLRTLFISIIRHGLAPASPNALPKFRAKTINFCRNNHCRLGRAVLCCAYGGLRIVAGESQSKLKVISPLIKQFGFSSRQSTYHAWHLPYKSRDPLG